MILTGEAKAPQIQRHRPCSSKVTSRNHAQEDANGFAAFDFAATVENTLQDVADSGLFET
jgi:hypothetical protein